MRIFFKDGWMGGTDLQLGVGLALLCAFATNLGFMLKHRGATQAPPVDFRHPVRSAVALFRSRAFLAGYGVAAVAMTLHVAALWFAPISIVQSTISGGLVFLAVIAERMFGLQLGRRQWAGVVLTAFGLMLLALTVRHAGEHQGFSISALIAFEAGALLIGIMLLFGPRLGAASHHHGLLLAAASGMLIGVSDIAIKAMTNIAGIDGVVAALVSPWLVLAVALAVVSFFSVAKGLQVGEAVPVITMIGVAASLVQIVGGIVVFNDPLPSGTLGMIAQGLGFVLICAAAALVPAPTRVPTPQTA
jgi:drug/metabolite transporter (DMT)-like permease